MYRVGELVYALDDEGFGRSLGAYEIYERFQDRGHSWYKLKRPGQDQQSQDPDKDEITKAEDKLTFSRFALHDNVRVKFEFDTTQAVNHVSKVVHTEMDYFVYEVSKGAWLPNEAEGNNEVVFPRITEEQLDYAGD